MISLRGYEAPVLSAGAVPSTHAPKAMRSRAWTQFFPERVPFWAFLAHEATVPVVGDEAAIRGDGRQPRCL